jgi:phage terminase large subunit-like protein
VALARAVGRLRPRPGRDDPWAHARAREAQLAGRVCFGGLDLSSKLDLTALVLAFPGGRQRRGRPDLCRFWLPEATIERYTRKGQRHYEAWAREGWLSKTPGNVIDYEFIRAEVNALATKYAVKEIAFDPWGSTQLATQLMGDGHVMVETRQGYKTSVRAVEGSRGADRRRERPPRGKPRAAVLCGQRGDHQGLRR